MLRKTIDYIIDEVLNSVVTLSSLTDWKIPRHYQTTKIGADKNLGKIFCINKAYDKNVMFVGQSRGITTYDLTNHNVIDHWNSWNPITEIQPISFNSDHSLIVILNDLGLCQLLLLHYQKLKLIETINNKDDAVILKFLLCDKLSLLILTIQTKDSVYLQFQILPKESWLSELEVSGDNATDLFLMPTEVLSQISPPRLDYYSLNLNFPNNETKKESMLLNAVNTFLSDFEAACEEQLSKRIPFFTIFNSKTNSTESETNGEPSVNLAIWWSDDNNIFFYRKTAKKEEDKPFKVWPFADIIVHCIVSEVNNDVAIALKNGIVLIQNLYTGVAGKTFQINSYDKIEKIWFIYLSDENPNNDTTFSEAETKIQENAMINANKNTNRNDVECFLTGEEENKNGSEGLAKELNIAENDILKTRLNTIKCTSSDDLLMINKKVILQADYSSEKEIENLFKATESSSSSSSDIFNSSKSSGLLNIYSDDELNIKSDHHTSKINVQSKTKLEEKVNVIPEPNLLIALKDGSLWRVHYKYFHHREELIPTTNQSNAVIHIEYFWPYTQQLLAVTRLGNMFLKNLSKKECTIVEEIKTPLTHRILDIDNVKNAFFFVTNEMYFAGNQNVAQRLLRFDLGDIFCMSLKEKDFAKCSAKRTIPCGIPQSSKQEYSSFEFKLKTEANTETLDVIITKLMKTIEKA